MSMRARRANYAAIWALALAFGVVEGAVAVYLREIYVRDAGLGVTSRLPDLEVTLVSVPEPLLALEIVREAFTMVLLAGAGWLAGGRLADRAGAFLLAFGVWDLVYYVVIWLFTGWPVRLGAWDILFLIPVPWVAPVWAPAVVAFIFIVAGSYLFSKPDVDRRYGWADAAVLLAAMLLTLASFLIESQTAVVHRVPERFSAWLYWPGVVLGTFWFVRHERAAARRSRFPAS
jgi:hypothetical protein